MNPGSVASLAIVQRSGLLRECLAAVLARDRGLGVAVADPDSEGLVESFEQTQPHVVLIDLGLPGRLAVHLTQEIRKRLDRCKIILLARDRCDENLLDAIAAGAHGCVLERASIEELQSVIGRVLRGEMFCSPEILQSMFTQLAKAAKGALWPERADSARLTVREREILELVAARLSNKEIAKKLCLSLHTVKNHVHNIVEKLQVEDRHSAVEYAHRHDWLPHRASRFDSTHGG